MIIVNLEQFLIFLGPFGPFSSPAVIAKFKDVPCIFYDAAECVRNQSSHGIPLLRSKGELKEWFTLLTKKVN